MGDQAALTLALEQAELDDEAEQLGLFGVPATPEGQARAIVKRGPGRPPGSRNKRTERTVAFLLARHRDPREVLLEIAEANIADLAALVGCSVFEALQEKRIAAAAVLPYLAQRMPLAVDVTQRQVVYLTINDGQAELASDAGAGLTARVLDSVEYQRLSSNGDDDVAQSDVSQQAQSVEIKSEPRS